MGVHLCLFDLIIPSLCHLPAQFSLIHVFELSLVFKRSCEDLGPEDILNAFYSTIKKLVVPWIYRLMEGLQWLVYTNSFFAIEV